MIRTLLGRGGLILIAFCTLSLLVSVPRAMCSASPGSAGWSLKGLRSDRSGFLGPADRQWLRRAAFKSRQQPGNTGSGPGPGQQLPRDLDLTFVDNAGAPGNVNAPTKATLPPYTDWEPDYSPDRRTIVFSSDRPVGTATSSTGFHLWSMETDGSYQQQVPNTSGTDQEWPAISTDGSKIAYSARDANNVEQIHVLDQNANTDTVITDGAGDKTHPTWSQDVIAFQSTERTTQNPAGLNKIWLVNFTGGPRAQLTGLGTWDSANASSAQDTEPTWEPNGLHIAFTRKIGTQTERIFLIGGTIFAPGTAQPASAAHVGQLTNFTAGGAASSDKDPAWRPEGPDYQSNPGTNPDNDVLAFASTRKSSPNFRLFGNGATSVGTTYGIYKMPITYSDPAQLNWQMESRAVVVAEDTQHPPFQYDNIHPSWTPEETVNTVTGNTEIANRVAYASNSGIPYSNGTIQYTSPRSNYDIWTSELVDLTPPTPLALPSVTPRLVAPGQPVTITARFDDLNAGIDHIYVQIKNPNSYLQDPSLPPLRNRLSTADTADYGSFLFDGHRVYSIDPYFLPHIGMPTYRLSGVTEVGYQPINPVTDSYADGGHENLPFDLTGVDLGLATIGNPDSFQPTDSLELRPSTNPSDPPGTFTATWTTDPNRGSDYYIDLIAVDKAGNLEDYDNIWGFSTKQFGGTGLSTNHILLVNDYMSPQQFLIGRGSRLAGEINGVESWFTDNPLSKFGPDPFPVGSGGNINTMNQVDPVPAANPDNPGMLRALANSLGPWSWIDWPGSESFLGTLDFGPVIEPNFNPSMNLDSYDDWRILSRGPIPASVLSNYGPLTVNEPSANDVTQLTPRKVNYSCVVWGSPFTNDEFVGPGTIVDVNTRQELSDFIAGGGHVFLTGQDIAWALSLGDPAANTPATQFLATSFGVKFNSDDGGRGVAITAQSGPIGNRWRDADTDLHPLAPFHLPFEDIIYIGIGTGYDWLAAGDQEFPDTLTTVGAANADYVQGGQPDLVTLNVPATDHKTVFAGFGIEGIDNGHRNIAATFGSVTINQSTSENQQSILMHGIVCWMRDYRASGQVNLLENDGRLQPFPNVLVRAVLEGTNTVVATALSRGDGTFTLNGLPTGTGGFVYPTSTGYEPGSNLPLRTVRAEGGPRIVLEAIRPGYAQAHISPALQGHADETATANQQLSIAPPGIITGRVTDAGTGKGIAGAKVTIVNKPFSDIRLSTTTDANGNYTINNVPATPSSVLTGTSSSSYIVTFSAPGYQTFIVGNDPSANNKTTITVTSQATTIVNAALVPAKGSISGKVVDPSGAAVAGAVVTATPKNLTTGLVTAITASDGTFTFTNISPDTYSLVATKAPLSPSASQDVVLSAGGNVTGVVLTLQTPRPGVDSISGTVRFSVQGASPVPAPGIPVQLEDATGAAIGGPVSTDANGQYTFTGLQDGTYKVQPRVANQTVTPRTVTLPTATGPAATGVDFLLTPIYTFPAGMSMISLPFDFSGTNVDVAQLLGLPIVSGQAAIASYDPSTNQYSLYPNLNANVPGAVGTQTLPGRGYWVREAKATAFLTGGSPITAPTFDVTVLPGWNMIGDPYTGAVAWNLVQVEAPFQVGSFAPNTPFSMQLAQSQHIINSPLYTWNGTAYTTTTTLRPFVGYWIYVDPTASQNLPITLTFTNPSP